PSEVSTSTDHTASDIYTLSLHDALPISRGDRRPAREIAQLDGGVRVIPARHIGFRDLGRHVARRPFVFSHRAGGRNRWLQLALQDRKSTRLNSSHVAISYAVFCLKKKTQ